MLSPVYFNGSSKLASTPAFSVPCRAINKVKEQAIFGTTATSSFHSASLNPDFQSRPSMTMSEEDPQAAAMREMMGFSSFGSPRHTVRDHMSGKFVVYGRLTKYPTGRRCRHLSPVSTISISPQMEPLSTVATFTFVRLISRRVVKAPRVSVSLSPLDLCWLDSRFLPKANVRIGETESETAGNAVPTGATGGDENKVRGSKKVKAETCT